MLFPKRLQRLYNQKISWK